MQETGILRTKDGQQIGIKLYTNHNLQGKVIMIGPSAAVTQAHYYPIAAFFQSQGHAVITFDYRGVGLSAPETLKGYKAGLHQWAVQDMDAVIRFTRNQFPGRELVFIGHGISGELIGLAPASQYINRMVLINCSLTCEKLWPWQNRVRMRISKTMIRVLNTVYGYFPGKRMGYLRDLPKGVMNEWINWCNSNNGLFDKFPDNNYRKLQVPLLAFSFADDWRSPPKAVQALLQYFSCAQVTWHHFDPADAGMKSIGHLGPFEESCKDFVWEELGTWLRN